MTDEAGFPIGGPIEHPRATTVLVLGVLGLLCLGFLSPIAWIAGVRAMNEIDGSGGYFGGRHQARLGKFLGMVGTVLMIGMCLLFLLDACR